MKIRTHRIGLPYEALESRVVLAATHIFVPQLIDRTTRDSFGFQARSAFATDVDGDGDLDAVSSSRIQGTVAWHENIDGNGAFDRRRHIISAQGNQADFILAADLDGDDDQDVLYSSSLQGRIAWQRNLGADGFDEAKVIGLVASPSIGRGTTISLTVADLDGDGDTDVISSSPGDDTVAWYENTDAKGTFGTRTIVTNQADGAASVFAADLDGDDDIDIVSASALDDAIAWYENLDGSVEFSDRKLISTPNPGKSAANFVSAADLDGDGDLDVLAASYIDMVVAWYEHVDGRGTFDSRQILMQGLFRHISPRIDSVYAADLDGDSDLDIVSADELNHTTYFAENLDGRGHFASQQPIAPSTELTGGSFQIVDIDDDGDADILAASDHEGIIAWHENRLIGDSNDDGVFNTSDLVRVFQAGQYLDGASKNSTFDEGDWNLDGEFDSSDLVFVFQAGHYGLAAMARPNDEMFVDDASSCNESDFMNDPAFVA